VSAGSELLDALYRGDGETAERLAADRDDLNLFEAAALGRSDRVFELLQGDHSLVEAWSPDGFTALHLAAFFSGDGLTVHMLCALGGDPNAVSGNEMRVTPLGSAAARLHGEAVLPLLVFGGNPNAAQNGGYTPLHSAAAGADRELVDLLLRYGADPHARSEGGTPAELAARYGHPEVAAWLGERDASRGLPARAPGTR
jgi:ankyrin repeat protein